MYNQIYAIQSPENDALGTFQVPWTHVAMQNQKLDSELEKYLIKEMSESSRWPRAPVCKRVLG